MEIASGDLQILLRIAEQLVPSEAEAFIAQLNAASVSKQDDAHISFTLRDDGASISRVKVPSTYLSAFYNDADSELVNIIVHFVDGKVSWMERFRAGEGAIIDRSPDPKRIFFMSA